MIHSTRTMSSFIPRVSSSPPPFDDVPGFDGEDEGWDDFTGFTGPSDPDTNGDKMFKPIDVKAVDSSDPPQSDSANHSDWANFSSADSAVLDDFTGFAAFETQEDTKESINENTSDPNIDSSESSGTCGISDPQNEGSVSSEHLIEDSNIPETSSISSPDEFPVGENIGHQCNAESRMEVTSQCSAADSGLSSDVSPGPKPSDVTDFSSVEHSKNGNDSGTDAENVRSSVSSENGFPDDPSSFIEATEEVVEDSQSADSNEDKHSVQSGIDHDEHVDNFELESVAINNYAVSHLANEMEIKEDSSKNTNPEYNHDSIQIVDPDNNSERTSETDNFTLQTEYNISVEGVCSSETDVDTSESQPTDPDTKETLIDQSNSNSSGLNRNTEKTVSNDDNDFDDFTEFQEGENDSVTNQPANADDDFTDFEAKEFDSGRVKDADDLCFKEPSVTLEEESPESLDLKLPAADEPSTECEADHSNDDDDGWSEDFTSFPDAASGTEMKESESWAAFGTGSDPAEPDTDWAAFEANQKPHINDKVMPTDGECDLAQPASDDDDDFGDFEDVPVTRPTPSSSAVPQLIQALSEKGRLKQLLEKSFPAIPSAVHSTLDILLLLSIMELDNMKPETPPDLKSSNKTKSAMVDVCVWNNLKELNKTAALKYVWVSSTNNQKLLKACNVDTRNILMGHKKPSVPIFYQQAILEPSRGTLDDHRDSSPDVQETLVPDTSLSTVISQSVASSATGNGVAGRATSQEIPPAEFDWSSSGLTNPLDASSRIQLDLDFFIQKDSFNGTAPIRSSKVLQQEQEILQALDTAASRPPPPKTLPSIESILAGMNFTPTTPGVEKQEMLSSEAQSILGKLPNLSFLNASVLMFPLQVNGTNNEDY